MFGNWDLNSFVDSAASLVTDAQNDLASWEKRDEEAPARPSQEPEGGTRVQTDTASAALTCSCLVFSPPWCVHRRGGRGVVIRRSQWDHGRSQEGTYHQPLSHPPPILTVEADSPPCLTPRRPYLHARQVQEEGTGIEQLWGDAALPELPDIAAYLNGEQEPATAQVRRSLAVTLLLTAPRVRTRMRL